MGLEKNFWQDRRIAREEEEERNQEKQADKRFLKAREKRRADEEFAYKEEAKYRPGAGGAYVEGYSDPKDFKVPGPGVDKEAIEAMADDIEVGTHKEKKHGIQDVKRISSRKQVRAEEGWVDMGDARQPYGKKYNESNEYLVRESTRQYQGRKNLAEGVSRIQTEKSGAFAEAGGHFKNDIAELAKREEELSEKYFIQVQHFKDLLDAEIRGATNDEEKLEFLNRINKYVNQLLEDNRVYYSTLSQAVKKDGGKLLNQDLVESFMDLDMTMNGYSEVCRDLYEMRQNMTEAKRKVKPEEAINIKRMKEKIAKLKQEALKNRRKDRKRRELEKENGVELPPEYDKNLFNKVVMEEGFEGLEPKDVVFNYKNYEQYLPELAQAVQNRVEQVQEFKESRALMMDLTRYLENFRKKYPEAIVDEDKGEVFVKIFMDDLFDRTSYDYDQYQDPYFSQKVEDEQKRRNNTKKFIDTAVPSAAMNVMQDHFNNKWLKNNTEEAVEFHRGIAKIMRENGFLKEMENETTERKVA